MDAHTRYINGATCNAGHCELNQPSCRGCKIFEYGWPECQHYHCDESEMTVDGCSITVAKNLLKEFGGSAWTEHCERNGGCFGITPIELGKNNSKCC